MKLPDEEIAVKDIPVRFKQTWAEAEQVWTVVSGLIQPGVIAPGVEPQLRWAIAGIHTKHLRLARSIFLLLGHGLDQEAKPNMRVMFELFLHLKYIFHSRDRHPIARSFLLWNHVNDAKIVEVLSQQQLSRERWETLRQALKPLVHEYRKEIEQIAIPTWGRWLLQFSFFKEIVKRIGLERIVGTSRAWQKYVQHGPPMMNMDQLAKRFKLGATYDHVYRDCSGAVHNYDAFFYVQPGEETFSVAMCPTIIWTEELAKSTLCLLVDMASMVNSILSLGKEQQIQQLTKLSFCKQPDEAH